MATESEQIRIPIASAAGERIVSLQVLRFVAATGVIILHAWQTLGRTSTTHFGLIGQFGPAGVDLFFVLSGFIITSVSHGKTASEFLKRRFTRILPLYWTLTVLMMAVEIGAGMFDPRGMISSFLFVPMYGPYVAIGWTLCFEVLFYLCFAFALLKPKQLVPVILGLYVTAAIGREILGSPLLQFVGNPLILEFLAGCLIAFLPRSRTLAWISGICAMAWGALIFATGYEAGAHQPVLSGDAIWLRVLMWGVFAFFVIYFSVQLRLKGTIWNMLSYFGDASYSAYLVHEIVLIVFILARGLAPSKTITFLAIISCWTVAVLVHEGLEKPLSRIFRRPMVAPTKEFLAA